MVRALLVDDGVPARITQVDEDFLGDAEVEIDVEYSGINYKDGLAITGSGPILRRFPLIAGIDLAGTVTRSTTERVTVGQRFVLNGDGIGESLNGGLATRAHVRSDALVVLPGAISTWQAAAIGTAGFTAMLGVLAIEEHGVEPRSGDVLVTGAGGGVGSLAVALLAARGHRVVASTGRGDEQAAYLHGLGAEEILDRRTLQDAGKPLQGQRWAAAIDSTGSATLANVLAQTSYSGIVVACGLAQGADLPTTVLPFILRGVTLHGANSVDAPLALRERAWNALAADLDPALLDELSETVGLDDAARVARDILEGRVRGRTVVDVHR